MGHTTDKRDVKTKLVTLHRTCLLCGRPLKKLESRKLGYGPVCHARNEESKGHRRRLF